LVFIIESADAVGVFAEQMASADLLPLDVESNGLHAYRPVLCTMQIGIVRGGDMREIAIVDTTAIGDEGLAPLRRVLGPDGPRKILHDLAFDARILGAHGIALGNVIDTSVAARFLGLTSTGLGTLVEQKLGKKLSKEHQHHDWAARPLTKEHLEYLHDDVAYLPELARQLMDEATARDIVPEIEAETEYRIGTALASLDERDPRPPYVRIKGATALDPLALAVLRRVADVREEAAQRWNQPPFKVVGNEVLLELAKKRPADPSDMRKIRGLDRGRGVSLIHPLRKAIGEAVREGDIPLQEREQFFVEAPKPDRAVVEARRGREQRLSAWRKKTAKERTVDDQVVLPGHCLQDIVDAQPTSIAELATIPGIGARRVERDGAAILEALHSDRANA
jgi:ribonuclease D